MESFGVGADAEVSDAYKVFITQEVDGRSVTVVGYIGEGSATELTAAWDSPFAEDSAGASFSKAGGAIQSISQDEQDGGLTSVSTWNSQQVWSGNSPISHNFTLYLKAYADANREVDLAIKELKKMASPELNSNMIGGRTPQVVTLNIGRQRIYQNIVIETVGHEEDAPKTPDRFFTRNTVTLSLQAKGVVNRSQIR
ncbi:hypothetical protein KO527_05415 [Pseudoalteromonas sp. C2R02]|uniref:hypothetical protein n=1 Tax=Pseudoalteromonas sp. C2R02 TaxID=2841565 RepID=UPI001C08A317|nr:hypothetical protein [Pseudoalteromonas sp. C2R02]MBU2968787.1 hypothetical protein [Pseudoalteromonas sp. C2R02]